MRLMGAVVQGGPVAVVATDTRWGAGCQSGAVGIGGVAGGRDLSGGRDRMFSVTCFWAFRVFWMRSS